MSKRPLSFSRILDLPENHSALTAVKGLADSLASNHRIFANPLYLFGGHGTGKTTLVKTLEADVLRRKSKAIVNCTPTDELGGILKADPGEAWENPRPGDELDLLIIEDLQHLLPRLAQPLADLIDEFLAQQVPLVFTASLAPQRLPFAGRLTTRLASGLVVGLEPWKPASRLAFLQAKAQERQLAIRQETLSWLASHIRGCGRELEGALNRLEGLESLHRGPLDLGDVSRYFQDELESNKPTVNRITTSVSDYFHVPASEVISSRRTRSILLPRQVSMYLTRQLTDLSLEEIGASFGGRDHSTVLHACRKVAGALTQDRLLAATVDQLQAALT
jgi:chromosomal replication initiator protein